jgi:hypothetical protein
MSRAVYDDLIIVASRHQIAAHPPSALPDGALEDLEIFAALRFEADADDNGRREARPLMIERRGCLMGSRLQPEDRAAIFEAPRLLDSTSIAVMSPMPHSGQESRPHAQNGWRPNEI